MIPASSKQGFQNEVDEVYIMMEFCTGEELVGKLNRLVERRQLLSESEVLRIFSDICEGVAHLHNQNPPITHRDLKVRILELEWNVRFIVSLSLTLPNFSLC